MTTTSVPRLHVPKTFTALGAASLVALAAILLDPPTLSLSGAGVMLAAVYAACQASPVLLMRRGQVETITLGGVPFTAALVLLPPGEALMALGGGALAGRFVSRVAGPLPRIREAPLERHLFNLSTDLLSVALAIFVLKHISVDDTYLLALVAVGLELVTQEVQHWFVESAIAERNRTRPRRPRWRPTAQGLASLYSVLAAALRSGSSFWPMQACPPV